jgi:biofilm PGA synthesis N-glycosyltransferase PgaC
MDQKSKEEKSIPGEATQGHSLSYVLITPARNEEAFIEQTIQSVINQTILPLRWVIVSDGSTDRTDEIVLKYTAEHSWIELVRMPERAERHFSGKVHAFNAGYARVKDLNYDIIGSLDADITFDEEYCSFLLSKFVEHPQLGVGGTPFREGSDQYDYRFTSIEHVSGACQLFRHQCFKDIDGYKPMKGGGIDLVAVLKARMKGWETRSFPEKCCLHHRKMGSAKFGPIKTRIKDGQKDYIFGSHPGWEVFRAVYQMSKKPYVIGGLALFGGYIWSVLKNIERPVPVELIRFRRMEQMQRLRIFFSARKVHDNH